MAMKIVTLLQEKGGVAKSSTAVHIAAGLAILGKRVILVDADPQGHAGLMIGIGKEPGLYDVLVRNAPLKNVLRFVSPEVYERSGEEVKGQLFVLPSNVETRNIATSISDAFAIIRKFRPLRDSVDTVIFDTSPTPSLLHGSIYMATDAIIYPTKCESLSFDGLMESLQHRSETEEFRSQQGLPPIQTLGIVPTLFRKKTLEHQENLEELRKQFGSLVWDPVALSPIWAEATRMQRTVWNTAPKTQAAKEAWGLVEQTLERLQHVQP
jgi:chromosome partitioning protein